MQRWVTVPAAVAAALVLAGAQAGAPHEHGVARLDIGVEPGRVSLQLQTPLDNLLGFERAPRNEEETQRAEAVLKRLRAADALFRIDSAAGCTLQAVDLQSAALGLGRAPAPEAKEGHAELQAQIDFQCRDGTRTGFIEAVLFEAFPRLQRIDVQVASPKGQMKAMLRRPNGRIALVR
jgi:hypothetical protein